MSFKRGGVVALSAIIVVLLYLSITLASDIDYGGLQSDVVTSVPRSMTYQGILKDSDGEGIPDSFFDVTFKLFDAESDGTELWSQLINVGTDANGYFAAELTNLNIPFDSDYWLELEIESEVLTPRQKLAMVGYAATADTADYAKSSVGDITAVNANDGLVGGGTENDVNLSVGAGVGIVVNPDEVAVDFEALAGRGLVEINDSISIQTGTGLEIYSDAIQLEYEFEHGIAFDDRFVNSDLGSSDFPDEPGLAEEEYDEGDSGLNILDVNTFEVLANQTIDCPADGYVLVIGTFMLYAHSQYVPSHQYGEFGVSTMSNQWVNDLQYAFRVDQLYNTDFRWPITVHGVFEADLGPNTYYLLGRETSGHLIVGDVQLSLMYFPTAYGTVYPDE